MDAVQKLHERPAKLLTSNSNLAPHGIKNWTLPAWAGRLPDGRTYNTCPSAGQCGTDRLCYALKGAYVWRGVRARHEQNLAYVLDDLDGWQAQMSAEIGRLRPSDVQCPVCRASGYRKKIRIHDAGDFFSDAYTKAWLAIADEHPGVFFYAYTKEVKRGRELIEPGRRPNFGLVYSLGGKQDGLLDHRVDRHCDVFPTTEHLLEAGYHDQVDCDLLAVLGPKPVGMAVNNNAGDIKKLGTQTFGQRQNAADLNRLARWADRAKP